MVMITQLCKYAKSHWIVYFKWVIFVSLKLLKILIHFSFPYTPELKESDFKTITLGPLSWHIFDFTFFLLWKEMPASSQESAPSKYSSIFSLMSKLNK